MNHAAEIFYVKHFLILHFFLPRSSSNEQSSKTNPELFQPKEMQTYINGSLIFKKLSCIMASTKNIFSHLITTFFYTNANSFTSLLSTKDPKRVLLLISTYPFFCKIQSWQVQSSSVGRFPVNWHHVTIIVSQSIPNPGQRNKGTKMQTSKQAATESAATIFLMIMYLYQ